MNRRVMICRSFLKIAAGLVMCALIADHVYLRHNVMRLLGSGQLDFAPNRSTSAVVGEKDNGGLSQWPFASPLEFDEQAELLQLSTDERVRVEVALASWQALTGEEKQRINELLERKLTAYFRRIGSATRPSSEELDRAFDEAKRQIHQAVQEYQRKDVE